DLHQLPRGDAGDSAQLVEVPVSGEDDLRRLEETGLDVTHDHELPALGSPIPGYAKVVLYSARERERLSAAGFAPTTVIPDLPALDLVQRRRELSRRADPALPSGRTAYRQPQDYTSDMKALAEANPALVRKVTLPLASLEGRPIEGIEIATGVNRTDDGRPVYLQMGVHHAREWPSGEFPMEFATELVQRFNAGDPRVVSLLGKVRTIVIPVVNPDGFAVSRGAGPSPVDDNSNATSALSLNDQAAYKRKNCRPTVPGSEATPCAMRSNSGVDLNRNYGAYWGGPGSGTIVTAQNYRGPSPYSEPESEAVHRFTAGLHVVTFITNHTFTADGKFLRQPGFDASFLPDQDAMGNRITPDEAGMKALGDSMADASGWVSELGYETLGDITGATEDWNYFSQGTYGYTTEGRGPNFHGTFGPNVVEEYEGKAGKPGIGEAFLRAGEQAADPAGHSIIRGTAGAGRILRLKKTFTTETITKPDIIGDTLDTTLTVPASGSYEWHVNQSKRPLFASSDEAWTMTCESAGGQVLDTATVTVARGASVTEDLACPAAPSAVPPGGGGGGGGGGGIQACDSPTGRAGPRSVDRARLGRLRAPLLAAFARREGGRRTVDVVCLEGPGSLRIGYPGAGLLRTLSGSEKRRVRGRAILLLTSSPRFALRGVRPGARTSSVRRRFPRVRSIRVGLNRWFVVPRRGARLVLKSRDGRIEEVGLADSRLVGTRARAGRFLRSFR
ncbi:MAG: M14 family zinc carboxypeptidase, partial [Thermoleophilaceae bacterium]